MPQVTIEQVIASPRLPSLPAVAVRIIDLVQQPDVSIEQLATVIANDAALASKILRMANSSFYARSRSVSRLSDALMVLGLRRVKTLALGFSLVDDLRSRSGSGFNHGAFWDHSLFAAVGARALATQSKLNLQEEAFLGGLTHSLGILALNQAIGAAYTQIFEQADGDLHKLADLERQQFGFDHAALGGALGEQWNLPPGLTACMRWSASPEFAAEEHRRLVLCVQAGSLAADFILARKPKLDTLLAFQEQCRVSFGIESEESEDLLHTIAEDAGPMRALLDLPQGQTVRIGELLLLANEALQQITLEADNENVRLEQERTQLVHEVSTDALTGVANRRRFDEFLDNQLRMAVLGKVSVGLLMIDIDHFKKVNDTYGHPVGDLVLRSVAKAIQSQVRADDVVARFGGEEFSVVLPNTPLRGAGVLGKRIRQAVEAAVATTSTGTDIKVTASVGVAAIAPRGPIDKALLVKAADDALYEAKQAGRNTVRLGTTEAAAA